MVVMLTSFLLRTKTFSTVPCIEQIIKMCLSNQTKTKQKNTKKKKKCVSQLVNFINWQHLWPLVVQLFPVNSGNPVLMF